MKPDDRNRAWAELCRTYDEVPGSWHIGRLFPALTADEFEQTRSSIVAALTPQGTVGGQNSDTFWVIDQFLGDRTHKVEIVDHSKISASVLQTLQQILVRDCPLWRIVLVSAVHDDELAIWIHPDRITCDDALAGHTARQSPADVLALWSA